VVTETFGIKKRTKSGRPELRTGSHKARKAEQFAFQQLGWTHSAAVSAAGSPDAVCVSATSACRDVGCTKTYEAFGFSGPCRTVQCRLAKDSSEEC
jgi:hypothetical protein